MLENRSFDNLSGYLYEKDAPKHFIPDRDQVFPGVAGRDDLVNTDTVSAGPASALPTANLMRGFVQDYIRISDAHALEPQEHEAHLESAIAQH